MTELTTGQRIAQCRKQLNLSQEGLGEKVGVSRQAISKWEADAAMPDIDKLITLSKLFEVSVGWLLGVEEMPESQAESPQISEELLHKIEEVVQRYQPKKNRIIKILAAAAAAALLLLGASTFRGELAETQARIATLAGQLQRSNQQYSAISGQLDMLEERIDNINTTVEEASAALASCQFRATPDMDAGAALLRVQVVPKTWNENWTAVLSVRYQGSQILTQTCAWDGSALISTQKVSLLDGYEFWLVITYPDGNQEQIQLENPEAEALQSSMALTFGITMGSVNGWSIPDGWVSLDCFEVSLERPEILSDVPKNLWLRAELVLYHIRGEERIAADTLPILQEGEEADANLYLHLENQRFSIPGVELDDRLELWVEAELENGLTLSRMVSSWKFAQNGFVPAN